MSWIRISNKNTDTTKNYSPRSPYIIRSSPFSKGINGGDGWISRGDSMKFAVYKVEGNVESRS